MTIWNSQIFVYKLLKRFICGVQSSMLVALSHISQVTGFSDILCNFYILRTTTVLVFSLLFIFIFLMIRMSFLFLAVVFKLVCCGKGSTSSLSAHLTISVRPVTDLSFSFSWSFSRLPTTNPIRAGVILPFKWMKSGSTLWIPAGYPWTFLVF